MSPEEKVNVTSTVALSGWALAKVTVPLPPSARTALDGGKRCKQDAAAGVVKAESTLQVCGTTSGRADVAPGWFSTSTTHSARTLSHFAITTRSIPPM